MKNDDDQYAAHCEMFRKAGFTPEAVARAREAAERDLKEPAASELPALLEKHATRLAEMGCYDIAADVQLAAERLSHG